MKLTRIITLALAVGALALTGCSSDDPVMPDNPVIKPGDVRTDVNTMMIHETNPRMYGTDGARLTALTSQLDEIARMGCNVLWVMPVNDPGQDRAIGSPYCIRDFKAVDPHLGSMADFKALVDAAHARGMRVILDWIANHTAWDCAWISNTSWYETDAAGNIISPSGWTDVAELNYDNSEMRAAMIDAMLYWIREAGIDGFRCDHVDGVPHDFWAEAITAVRAALPGALMLAESSDKAVFDDGFDMMYGWAYSSNLQKLYAGKLNAAKFVAESINELTGVPEGKLVMRYAANHDIVAENTVAQLYGNAAAIGGAYALTVMLDEGVPMFYTSQMIDYTGTKSFFNYGAETFDKSKTDALAHIASAYAATVKARAGKLKVYQTGDAVTLSRSHDGSHMLVIVNPTGKDITVKTPIEMAGLSLTDSDNGATVTVPSTITLGAYEYLIYYN
ncbi:MAG: alpha-amylase family glycosyl hydrolase [Bacteroidales bacterium]|nr:alpha-amylase family glycosyl hydrolase [Bacteroidales bacterium]